MPRARRLTAATLLLVGATAAGKPRRVDITEVQPSPATGRGGARDADARAWPHPTATGPHGPYSTCVFATREVPPRMDLSVPVRHEFSPDDAIWGRCYLAARAGANKPGELVDTVYIDRRKVWEQAYDHALPSTAIDHLVAYGDVLRTVFGALGRGRHLIVIEGNWKRSRRVQAAYRGEFTYFK
jgi:hypothetical protein